MCVELQIAPMHMVPSEPDSWDEITEEMVRYLSERSADNEELETRERLRRELGS
jgi:hypothetical protein